MGCRGFRNESLNGLASSTFCFLMGGSPFPGRLRRGGRNGLLIMISRGYMLEMISMAGWTGGRDLPNALQTPGHVRGVSILDLQVSKTITPPT